MAQWAAPALRAGCGARFPVGAGAAVVERGYQTITLTEQIGAAYE